jgi:CrcB protein
LKYLIVGLGGFIGANLRYIVGTWAQQRWGPSFPYGTMLINVTGSFILGLFATLAVRLAWNDQWRLLVAIGFVGAYTTFSTFEFETLQLVSNGSWIRAFANIGLSVVFGFVAAFIGVVVGRTLLTGHAA